jgi:leader peptidase (prepilin peptidase) / N-methyltransferase
MMFMFLLFSFLFFVCWGSFLNVVAYRITFNKPFFAARSYCPVCKHMIAWYDNIPIISQLLILRGNCRSCKAPISWLYTFIEVLTASVMTALAFYTFYIKQASLGASCSPYYFASYFLFFSALIVATRTDLEAMVIPQHFTILLIPTGIILSWLGFTEITLLDSIAGATLGYVVLWLTATVFYRLTKKHGLGEGDMELLAMIGSFIGIKGAWFALALGSVSGLIIGGGYLLCVKKNMQLRIPFGPFLSLGATLYFFFETQILNFLFT